MKHEGFEVFAAGKKYLVKDTPKAKHVGLILIPDSVEQRVAQLESEVVELGTADGPYHACVGDRVIHSVHAGTPFMVGSVLHRVLKEEEIFAVMRRIKK
jgi:co-chaperonin GroES (HSP10)